MARILGPQGAKQLALDNFPRFLAQRAEISVLDTWHRGEQNGQLYMPQRHDVSEEYKDLANSSPTPWLGLVVQSLTQTCFLEGIRMPGSSDNLESWSTWQENGWDAKQTSLYRATFAHGLAFGIARPAVSRLTGKRTARLRVASARRMAAFWDEEDDDFPRMAIYAVPYAVEGDDGWTVQLYEENVIHSLSCRGDGQSLRDWTYISYETHPLPHPPIVQYGEQDIEGRSLSQVQPLIPLAKRIDQDTFDRLIVQRFGAWKVRYIAGMAKPDVKSQEEMQKIKLLVSDLLVSPDPTTKFGTLDATDLKGFIEARDADLRDLSAVSQTPPHHMLGLSSNMQAESLAAAEAGLQRKSVQARTSLGESHERLFRMSAEIMGNFEEAVAYGMQVRWRDMESRSLSQAADALGKLATQLQVPVEMLWTRIPNWTDSDTEMAKKLVEDGGVQQLLDKLLTDSQPPSAAPVPGNGGTPQKALA